MVSYLEFPFTVFLTCCRTKDCIHFFERNARRLWHNITRPQVGPETGARENHKGRAARECRVPKRYITARIFEYRGHTYAEDISISGGVIRPIKTTRSASGEKEGFHVSVNYGNKEWNKQLLIQFEAVDRETPLLRIERGNTSLGRTQPIGPKDMP
jgi:hypothetical protein